MLQDYLGPQWSVEYVHMCPYFAIAMYIILCFVYGTTFGYPQTTNVRDQDCKKDLTLHYCIYCKGENIPGVQEAGTPLKVHLDAAHFVYPLISMWYGH